MVSLLAWFGPTEWGGVAWELPSVRTALERMGWDVYYLEVQDGKRMIRGSVRTGSASSSEPSIFGQAWALSPRFAKRWHVAESGGRTFGSNLRRSWLSLRM